MQYAPTSSNKGFTLIELFLAMAVVVTSLVFLLGSLEKLSRFLSDSGVQAEALALGNGKILEWEESLRYGNKPSTGSDAGASLTNPALEWRSEISETEIDSRLYQMDIQIFKRGREKPLTSLSAQGWLSDLMDDEEEET